MISAVGGKKRTSKSENHSPLVELTSKLRVKAFTKQRRVEKSVSDREETTVENKEENKMMYLETK